MASRQKTAGAKNSNGQQNGNGQGERKPPVHEVRLGAIRASIWMNHSREGQAFYSVTINRRYLQGQDWKTATSFGRDDLLQASLVLTLAAQWCFENPANKQNADNDPPPPENGQPEEPPRF